MATGTATEVQRNSGQPLRAGTSAFQAVGFQNLVMASDLQRYSRAGDCHAACSCSWISPPRTL